MPMFDPQLIQIMRSALEEVMRRVPLEYATPATKAYLAECILKAAAQGQTPFGPYVGSSDIVIRHSVVDILGLNPIAISVFDNAAAAVMGMAANAGRSSRSSRPTARSSVISA